MVSEGKEGPELCGSFLFWKSCAEKIQQNVTVKRENQNLSVKKKINQPASSEEERRPEWEEESQPVGQAGGGLPLGKAISLSTLQRKTGCRRADPSGNPRENPAPCLFYFLYPPAWPGSRPLP